MGKIEKNKFYLICLSLLIIVTCISIFLRSYILVVPNSIEVESIANQFISNIIDSQIEDISIIRDYGNISGIDSWVCYVYVNEDFDLTNSTYSEYYVIRINYITSKIFSVIKYNINGNNTIII